ncbi:hypothetical protein J6590_105474, partial [Homalodisca vitripennis]
MRSRPLKLRLRIISKKSSTPLGSQVKAVFCLFGVLNRYRSSRTTPATEKCRNLAGIEKLLQQGSKR